MEKVAPPLQSPGARSRLAKALQAHWRGLASRQELLVAALLLLVGAALSLWTDTFLTDLNLLNVARASAWIAIAACGQCMVIIIGGIDLSAGSVMALAGLTSALCLQAGMPAGAAIIAGLLCGSLVGFVNGTLVGRVGLPPFIVTLGTMSIARGIALGMTGGEPVRNLPAEFRALGQSEISAGGLVLPIPLLYTLVIALLVSLLLSRTVLGRYIYTLGRNSRALAIAGVPAARLRVLVYTLSGMLTALAGLIMTARVGVAAPTAATSYELDIIAAAVIGGTSFFGGEGGIAGVLLGTALMQVVRNGLMLLGVPAQWQAVALGVMIVLVALLNYWRRRRVAV